MSLNWLPKVAWLCSKARAVISRVGDCQDKETGGPGRMGGWGEGRVIFLEGGMKGEGRHGGGGVRGVHREDGQVHTEWVLRTRIQV